MIWNNKATVELLNQSGMNTLVQHLSIEMIEIGADFLKATMPVTANHVQPFRILHGGASVVLAETLGSIASTMCIADLGKQVPVGIEINANHLKSVPEGGMVTGVCTPIRIGKQLHVWQIKIFDTSENLCCISRLTVSVIPRK